MIENWDWPQYTLALWWFGLAFTAVLVWIATDIKRDYKKASYHWIGVIALNIILYYGGFWT